MDNVKPEYVNIAYALVAILFILLMMLIIDKMVFNVIGSGFALIILALAAYDFASATVAGGRKFSREFGGYW